MIRALLLLHQHHHSWRPLLASARTVTAALPHSPLTTRAHFSMKAVTFDAPGGIEVLKLVDQARPSPGEVRHSASLAPRVHSQRTSHQSCSNLHARRVKCLWQMSTLV
jgi:hypothetical protein